MKCRARCRECSATSLVGAGYGFPSDGLPAVFLAAAEKKLDVVEETVAGLR